MKKITNEATLAIKNEVESLRERVKKQVSLIEKITNEKIKHWIIYGRPDFSELDMTSQEKIIEILYGFKTGYTRRNQAKQVIISFLRATQDEKYVEIANKLDSLSLSEKE